MDLYLMRHGETILNRYNKIQGWSDAPLTKKGEHQAKQAGRRLQDIALNAVYCSDLGRTTATARIALAHHPDRAKLRIQERFGLREVFFGFYEGLHAEDPWLQMAEISECKNIIELEKRYGFEEELDIFARMDPLGDAENADALKSRLYPCVDDILSQHAPAREPVLIVGHGLTLRFLIEYLVPDAPIRGHFLGNASLTKLSMETDGWHLRFFNAMADHHF